MTALEYVIGSILIAASLVLVVCVLLQSSKSHNLSGVISGGAETFFGKAQGGKMDKKLSTVTTIVAIAFAVVVIVAYLLFQ